jgi:hypothetical protein
MFDYVFEDCVDFRLCFWRCWRFLNMFLTILKMVDYIFKDFDYVFIISWDVSRFHWFSILFLKILKIVDYVFDDFWRFLTVIFKDFEGFGICVWRCWLLFEDLFYTFSIVLTMFLKILAILTRFLMSFEDGWRFWRFLNMLTMFDDVWLCFWRCWRCLNVFLTILIRLCFKTIVIFNDFDDVWLCVWRCLDMFLMILKMFEYFWICFCRFWRF